MKSSAESREFNEPDAGNSLSVTPARRGGRKVEMVALIVFESAGGWRRQSPRSTCAYRATTGRAVFTFSACSRVQWASHLRTIRSICG
jgi:hypothetical protein